MPAIEPDEFIELREDIAKKGVLEPIWLYEGKVLDGRSRYEAAVELNKPTPFNTYEGDDPLGFIISLNTLRKTLSQSQRACIALEALPYEERLAKQRQIESGRATGKANAKIEKNATQPLNAVSEAAIGESSSMIEKNASQPLNPVSDNVVGESGSMIEKNATQPLNAATDTSIGESSSKIEKTMTQPSKRAPQSRDIVAEKAGTYGGLVSTVKRIKDNAPELYERVKSGKMEAGAAKLLSDFKKNHPDLYPEALSRLELFPELTARQIINAVKNEEIIEGNAGLTFETGKKFSVILCDVPWRYGTPPPGVTGIEDHYPTMSIEELCAMGEQVKKIAADHAVLFFWVTSPFLELCFPIISSFGFSYKTSLVWHKVKHNMGFYSSVRHEFLLICTRGSFTPERQIFKLNEDGKLTYDTFHPEPSVFPSEKLKAKQFHLAPAAYDKEFEYREEPMEPSKSNFNSVYEEKSTVHSRKPKYYYGLIERLYPHGEKLEMFCREPQEGWTAWGNQSEKKIP